MNELELSLKRINKLIIAIRSLWRFIVRLILIYIPFLACLIMGFSFAIATVENKLFENQYMLLFASIGIAATLSGLSFGASGVSLDEERKRVYYKAGERLLHAVLYFILAIVLKYGIDYIYSSSLNDTIKDMIKKTTFISLILLFYIGLINCLNALFGLHHLLLKNNKLSFDDREVR
jgi:hypothetical protein